MKELTLILTLLTAGFSITACKSKKKKKEHREEMRQQNQEIKKLNLDRNNLPQDVKKKVNNIINNARKRRANRMKRYQ